MYTYPADNEFKIPLKPSSEPWLKLALDPFHDFPVSFNGMPDAHGEQTSLRTFHFVKTVTAPSSVAPGDKWDTSIFTLPLLGQTPLRQGLLLNPGAYQYSANPTQFTANVVNVSSRPMNSLVYDDANFADYSSLGPLSLNDQVPARIIAGGFEVHNTTPELYKGGSVLVRSTGASATKASFITGKKYTLADLVKGPAKDAQSASADPQARVWNASKGCYVPFRLKLDNTDFQFPTANSKIFYTGFGAQNDYAFITDNDEIVVSGDNDFGIRVNKNPVRDGNIEISAAHFMGLPYETTLEVTVKVIVEFSPTVLEDELALVRPAAPYDVLALQAYRNAIADLPAGVEVSFNAKGDWWRKFVKPAVNVTGTALSALFPEFAPLIGGGVVAANTLGDMFVKSDVDGMVKSIKKRPVNKVQPKAHSNTTPRNSVSADVNREDKPFVLIDTEKHPTAPRMLTRRAYNNLSAKKKKWYIDIKTVF